MAEMGKQQPMQELTDKDLNINKDLNIDISGDAIKNIDKENIKNTIVNFIVPLIALVVTLVLIFAVVVPTYSKIPELKQELDANNTKKGILETKKGVLNRLSDFETVVKEDTELFKKALASEPEVPELLTQIDTIAKESGLDVIKLSNSLADSNGTATAGGTDAPALPYNLVKVTLGVTGSYDQLILFNKNLEESIRLVEVEDFRFSTETGEGLGDYTANFVLKSPYLTITTAAVTDEPITVDISSPGFLAIVENVKSMKHYDITVQDYILENLEKQEQQQAEAEAEEETDTETTETTTTETTTTETTE